MKKDSNAPFRWIKVFMALALIVLLTGGAWFYHLQKEVVRQEVEKNLTAVAQLKADQIIDWRNNEIKDAGLLSSFYARYVIRFIAESGEENRKDLLVRFRSTAEQHDYADILLVATDGKELLSLSGTRDHYSGYSSALTTALRERRPVFIDLHTETQDRTPHISVVAPLFAVNGKASKPIGALILINDATQFLYPLIQSWPLPSKTAETLLVRRDGDHVLFLNNLRHQPDTALNLRIPLSRTDVPAVMAVQGKHGFFQGKDYRDVQVTTVILPIADSPWFMVSKVDVDEAFADWRSRSILLLALMFGLTAFVLSVGFALRQREKKALFKALYHAETALRHNLERHRITLKAIGDAVITTDAEGRVELLNPAAETLTGWREVETKGRVLEEVFNIVNAQTGKKAGHPVKQVLETGGIVDLGNHTKLIAKNGEEYQISDSAAPIKDENGRITGVVMVFRDVTESYRMQKEITQTARDWQTTFDATNSAIWILDKDQRVIRSNKIAEKIFQPPCQGFIGKHCWEVVHGTKEPIPECPILRMRNSLQRERMELQLDNRWVEVVVDPILDAKNQYAGAVHIVSDITGRKRAEEEVRSARTFLDTIVDMSPYALWVSDKEGTIIRTNRSLREAINLTDERIIGKYNVFKDVNLENQGVMPKVRAVFEKNQPASFSIQWKAADAGDVDFRNARDMYIDVSMFPIPDPQGELENVVCQWVDISDRKRAEEKSEKLQSQLIQAQKMESVGRLAGGVAHDYNNMLSVILGYTELALEKTAPSDPLHTDLKEVLSAARRSADITRKLLAFARRQIMVPKVFDLNETVEGMLKMLRQLIGEDIDLSWRPGAGLWSVKLDPSQLDQILANLCVNAQDAIALPASRDNAARLACGGGKIAIETDNVTFDKAYCADHAGFVPGEFVLLTVSDDGCGMGKEMLDKIFEPFFTTKSEGTGLGLATVYGIVKQNNGFINVYSERGKGTTFRIYLPRHAGKTGREIAESKAGIPRGRGETVLLVEDEEMIRKMGQMMLERLEYHVMTADTPGKAMRLAGEHAEGIDLLVTDVIMPGMNGRDLAVQLQTLYPNLKVLFMSGYTANVIAHRGELDEGVNFIQKPFSQKDLAVKIREVLDEIK